MKKCPFCAEEIQDEAVICRYCHMDLVKGIEHDQEPSARGEERNDDEPKGKGCGVVSLVVGFLILAGNILFGFINYGKGGERMLQAGLEDPTTVFSFIVAAVLIVLGLILSKR